MSIDFIQKNWLHSSSAEKHSENAKDHSKDEWHRFAKMITVATLLPLLLVPSIMGTNPQAPSLAMLLALLNFIGGAAHVGASMFFLHTPDFQDHRRKKINIYWIRPLCLTLFLAAGFTWGTASFQKHALLIYFIWQTWHYQRQNFGLLSMTGLATQTGPVTKWERVALDLGVFAGIGGLFIKMDLAENTILAPYAQDLYTAGSYLLCLNIPIAAYVFIKNPSFFLKPTRVLFFLLGCFFYTPTFLFQSPEAAIMSYALAHGWQYLVFMTYVAQRKPEFQRRNTALFLYCCLGGGMSLSLLSDPSLWGTWGQSIFGAYLGLVIWHFITDADIWKLREPFQRKYMSSAFPFLNNKKVST